MKLSIVTTLYSSENHVCEFYERATKAAINLCGDDFEIIFVNDGSEDGSLETRDQASDIGGTMRLGAQECRLKKGSLARELYGKDIIRERHRHRYEVNNNLLPILKKAGLQVTGLSEDKKLVEIIENPNHPWFVAAQFHPEFTSTPRDGHPLFKGFIKAAIDHQEGRFS